MEKLNKLLEEYPNWKWDLDSLKFLRPFIQWLVDNDKIDKEKVWKNESPDIFDYSFYEVVLMLLSIQDNPIEYLISVLR